MKNKFEGMPEVKGHYSPCVEHNGVLYISGQLPIDPSTGLMPEGIELQTNQTLKNIKNILEKAGSSINQLLQVRIYLSNVEMWGKVNELYAEFIPDHKPARCVVPTRDLHYGALIEIEATAYV